RVRSPDTVMAMFLTATHDDGRRLFYLFIAWDVMAHPHAGKLCCVHLLSQCWNQFGQKGIGSVGCGYRTDA
ncbi:hypothetical protein PIB30_108396, partial [Stylosanthes scabra]|nr:hypothetical protein [Stylosanthes scabra]